MEATYSDLATIISECALQCRQRRYLVAIAGAPGSGKSTIAAEIVKRLNVSSQNTTEKPQSQIAVCVGMDGFHYPRSYLDALPNRKEAYSRRGTPWTFDVDAILTFIRLLRAWVDRDLLSDSTTEKLLLAPSFSHALKDPVPDGIAISPSVSIIIIEGNYLLLGQEKWREISPLVDLRIFVDVDLEEARIRVARRHVVSGIEGNLEDALARVDRNDYLNGKLVKEGLVGADFVVVSVKDEIDSSY